MPRPAGAYAAFSSSRSIAARIAGDPDGRPNSGSDPVREARAGNAAAFVAAAVRAVGDFPQHRGSGLRRAISGGHYRGAPRLGHLFRRTARLQFDVAAFARRERPATTADADAAAAAKD